MQYDIFWCKVNKYYLNKRLSYFSATWKEEEMNYLVATCEVTDRAKQKRFKSVKQKLIQGYHVYITWCGVLKKGEVLTDEEFYVAYPELIQYRDMIHLLGEEPERVVSSEYWVVSKEYGVGSMGTKKYIVIQSGCDNFCTFCLTIHKRGKHSNRPVSEILAEINKFVVGGGKEIVLTWINLAARWCSSTLKTEETQFPSLLKEILEKTQIERIRISSLGPEYLNDVFFDVIQNPRILPHFHLSIQSFADPVLQAMKRNYSAADLDRVLKQFSNIKSTVPVSLGADIIVGFPRETEEDFQETMKGVPKYKITKLHAFPFSAHTQGQTIPASTFADQISWSIKKEREARLQAVADEVRNTFIVENKEKSHRVLVEGKGEWWTENYIKVPVPEWAKRGEVIEVEL